MISLEKDNQAFANYSSLQLSLVFYNSQKKRLPILLSIMISIEIFCKVWTFITLVSGK